MDAVLKGIIPTARISPHPLKPPHKWMNQAGRRPDAEGC